MTRRELLADFVMLVILLLPVLFEMWLGVRFW